MRQVLAFHFMVGQCVASEYCSSHTETGNEKLQFWQNPQLQFWRATKILMLD